VPDIHDLLTPDLLEQAHFRKSRRSDNSGSCVEVADNLLSEHGLVLVRDSKNPSGGVLAFTGPEWTAFVGGVHDGEFDL
jgi:hypothetical protein